MKKAAILALLAMALMAVPSSSYADEYSRSDEGHPLQESAVCI